eukprot:g8818.t2
MGFLLASAAANGLPTVVLGFGDHAWWPEGLGRKINALRRFVLDSALKPNDLVLFADAYDVLIQSTEQEIRESFERLERRLNVSLIFNGDRDCAPRLPDVCTDPRPVDVWLHPRVYLNSGAFIGRTFAMKSILLQDPVSDVMPGGLPSSVIQEVFRKRFPEQFKVLYDHIEVSADLRGVHHFRKRLQQESFLQALRAISCFRCKVLLHTDDECNFVQWDNEMCQELRMCLPWLIVVVGLLLWMLGLIPIRRGESKRARPMPAGGMQMAYPQMQGDMLAQQSPQGDTQATMQKMIRANRRQEALQSALRLLEGGLRCDPELLLGMLENAATYPGVELFAYTLHCTAGGLRLTPEEYCKILGIMIFRQALEELKLALEGPEEVEAVEEVTHDEPSEAESEASEFGFKAKAPLKQPKRQEQQPKPDKNQAKNEKTEKALARVLASLDVTPLAIWQESVKTKDVENRVAKAMDLAQKMELGDSTAKEKANDLTSRAKLLTNYLEVLAFDVTGDLKTVLAAFDGAKMELLAQLPADCLNAVLPSQMDTVAGDPRPQADQLDELPARALIKDKMRVMEFLEENGFESSNVNSRKQKWKIFSTYPLHEAVKQGNHQMVDLLLKFGANVHTTDYRWRSAFALAQQKQDRAAMEVFQRTRLWVMLSDTAGPLSSPSSSVSKRIVLAAPLEESLRPMTAPFAESDLHCEGTKCFQDRCAQVAQGCEYRIARFVV